MKTFQFGILIISLNFIYSQNCGRAKVGTSFSVGSQYASKGQFPWLAPLFYKKGDEFFCGSTIISERHLLSGE